MNGIIDSFDFASFRSTFEDGLAGSASGFGDTRSWLDVGMRQRDINGGDFNYGDFANAVFDFLDQRDGMGRPFDSFYISPLETEYDLSINPDAQTTTFTLYDRWNGVKDVFIFGDGNSAHLQVPLDNSDFSSSGQFSGQRDWAYNADIL